MDRQIPRKTTLIISVALLCVTVSMSQAAVIHVPADQPTIQAGIDAAVNGDTVLVADGTYVGEGNCNLSLSGKVITVASENGHSTTIVDCDYESVGFNVSSGIVDGFTVTNASVAISCSGSPTIRNCVMTGNRSQGASGLSIYGGSPLIENCSISHNSTYHLSENFEEEVFGGGVSVYESSATFVNCVIANNSCGYWEAHWCLSFGGGLVINGGSPSLINCTISGNHTCFGGAFAAFDTSLSIRNSIIWGNGWDMEGPIYEEDSTISIEWSCVQGGYAGTGNISGNPQLVTSGPYMTLKIGSPCIDAGNNALVPTGIATDCLGNSRLVDDPDTTDTGSGTPPIVDMGAVEFQSGAVMYCGNETCDEGENPCTCTYDCGEPPATETECSDGLDNDCDGALDIEDPDCAVCGDGQCTADETCTTCPDDCCFTGTIYVDDSAPAGGDGMSWGTALRSIQDAVDIATDGSVIIVADGRYTDRILVSGKGLTIRSVNGPDFTTIAGQYCYTLVRFDSADDSVFEGFLIQGQYCEDPNPMLSCNRSNMIVRNCRFEDLGFEYEFGWSGAISISNATAIVESCEFVSNTRAARDIGSEVIYRNCSFQENLECIDSENSTIHVTNCDFQENGNTIMLDGCSVDIVNSVFNHNGYGIGNDVDSDLTLVNSTFYRGRTSFVFNYAPDASIVNCVLWNVNGVPPIQNGSGANATVIYSCISGGYTGTGNIDTDPMFIDSYGGDLHLGADSPCIDAGNNAEVPADVFDLDGDGNIAEPLPFDLDDMSRFLDDPNTQDTGAGTAPIVDMGAYEHVSQCGDGGCNNGESPCSCPEDCGAPPATEGNCSDGFDDDCDGMTDLDDPDCAICGDDLCTGDETCTTCPEDCCFTGTVYVDDSALPGGDGMSWETAFQTIQEAMDIVGDGSDIVVADGLYKGSGNRDIRFRGKAITLVSQNGPESAIIDCSNAEGETGTHRGVRFIDGETRSAVLDGFTVTGATNSGIEITASPTIRNCIIANNRISGGYIRGAGVKITGGSPYLLNCVIRNNHLEGTAGSSTQAYGAGIYHRSDSLVTVVNCVIAANSIFDPYENSFGAGVYIGDRHATMTFRNCTIASNSYYGIWNDYSQGLTFYNCILWDDIMLGTNSHGYRCCIEDLYYSSYFDDLITGDPLLTSDYQLQPGSSCIDAGFNSYVPAGVLTDITGADRFLDDPLTDDTGQGTAPIVDLGAYEYYLKFCGDGECNNGEDSCSCPEDCGAPPATEENCSDGLDDDCDGMTDMDDPDCIICGDTICSPDEDQCSCPEDCGTPPAVEGDCFDGIDNDCDGDVDVDDIDCLRKGDMDFDQDVDLDDYALFIECLQGPGVSTLPDGVSQDQFDAADLDDDFDVDLQDASIFISHFGRTFCVSGDECDDELYCNGIEACVGGSCFDGDSPCGGSEICTEELQQCEADCNINGIADYQDIANGTSQDRDGNGIPDECQDIWFVDAEAPAGGDGLSWQTSFRYLQDAMAVASPGDRVYVADGVYYPDDSEYGNAVSGDRRSTFTVLDQMHLIGGFPGIDDPSVIDPDDRNLAIDVSILSGDLDENDGVDFANVEENSYNLIRAEYVGSSTQIDGFTIIRGNGDYEGDDISLKHGAGCFLREASPTIANCIFHSNTVSLYGAGIMIYTNSSPVITNCVFKGNRAYCGPGFGTRDYSSPVIVNCLFYDNHALLSGGAIFTRANCNSFICNCTIVNNIADRNGGAIYNTNDSDTTLVNSILWGNTTPSDPAILNYNDATISVSYSDIQGGWEGANINVDPLFVDPATYDYRLSSGSPCIDAASNEILPEGLDWDLAGMLRRVDDPATTDTGIGTAPIVDMGVYEYLPDCNGNGVVDDQDILDGTSLDCNTNIIPDECETDCNANGIPDDCDIRDGTSQDVDGDGIPDECQNNLFVDAEAPAGGDGLSWQTAFRYLQDAMAVASVGDRVLVADGVYYPDDSEYGNAEPGDSASTFAVLDQMHLIGGFPGIDDPSIINPDDRNLALNVTILSGDLDEDDGADFTNVEENSYNIIRAENVGSDTRIDGFTIIRGYGNDPENVDFTRKQGAGCFLQEANVTIANCIFHSNIVTHYGAGIMVYTNSNPVITNCIFYGNRAYNGPGIGMRYNASPVITNCLFYDNHATYSGGVIFNRDCNPVVSNCTFVNNSAESYGGAIYNHDSSMTLVNSVVWGNTAPNDPAIKNNNSTISVSYSDIQGGWYGTHVLNANPMFLSPPVNIYRLSSGSPCIDAGNNEALPAGLDWDLAGMLRRVNDPAKTDTGNGTAPIVDMGAYEYQP